MRRSLERRYVRGAARILIAAVLLTAGSGSVRAAQRAGPELTPYERAAAQVHRQELDAAIRTLEALLAQTPRDLRALNLLGIALTAAGRGAEGEARFRQALEIDPAFYPASKNLAIGLFSRGRFEEAERAFRQVLAHVPQDEVSHVHLAEIAHARGRCAAALVHYEKGGRRVAGNPGWLLHHAECLMGAGRQAESILLLRSLPAGDGRSAFAAGVLLGRAGAHADAAAFFERARQGHDDPYAAAYNQVLMLVEAGRHDAAIRVATTLIAGGDQPPELYSLLSRAHLGAGRIKDAYDALRTAVRLEPANEAHYIDLAMIAIDHENYDLGLEIVAVGLQYRPGSAKLHLQRGVLFAMKGQVERAEEDFDRARQAAPRDPVPDVALAMAWMQTGRLAQAIELLRGRAAAGQSAPVVFYMLGLALVRSGIDPAGEAGAEAVDALRTAVALSPGLAPAHAELGKLLLKRGDLETAVPQLEKAVALDPESSAPAYLLAQAYRRIGRMDAARALLARVSELNARERGDDPESELRRVVVRIVRENATARHDGAR